MSTQNAVCDCKDRSEKDLVLAIRQGRFAWLEGWGCLTCFLVFIMIVLTAGIWVFFILGWHIRDIVNPKYACQFCSRQMKNEQLRGYTNISTSSVTTNNSINDGPQDVLSSETPATDNSSTGLEERLKKIDDMFEQSLITEEEKKQMRSKVLGLG